MHWLFQALDTNGDGVISFTELRHIFDLPGENQSDDAIEKLIRSVDVDGHSGVSYAEFVTMLC